MSSIENRNQATDHQFQQANRKVRWRLAWLLVPVLLVVAVPAILYMYAQRSSPMAVVPGSRAPTHSVPRQPADRFIQSIVTEDGALGWHQLCPTIQAQLPMDELVQQANEQRVTLLQHGIRLTMRFTGTMPRQGGGTVRMYEVTAHWPGGNTQQRTFSVYTQRSGCVEDVQSR
jgi:hypothetical protein